jgi:hypothetical protein
MIYILLVCFIVYIGINLKTNKVMKELSTEEKARRYDEAIERANSLLSGNQLGNAWIYKLLPDLKESEDDRIRKELLEHCKNQAKPYIQTGNKCPQIQSWIDWLEKQGEQKIKTPEESLGIDSDTYNKIVDECIYGDDKSTWGKQGGRKPVDKKGMNLVEEEMTPFQKKVYCIIDTAIEEEQGLKQVCDELFTLASNEIKQKPAWSEEDKMMLQYVIEHFERQKRNCIEGGDRKKAMQEFIDWFKSLKERVQPQNA